MTDAECLARCPRHWVLCFSGQCPKAGRIKQVQLEQYQRTLKMLGDPRVGVHVPIKDTPT